MKTLSQYRWKGNLKQNTKLKYDDPFPVTVIVLVFLFFAISSFVMIVSEIIIFCALSRLQYCYNMNPLMLVK